ncbi:MAG: amino acid adenylation domain-containing protein [Rhodococcus sp.]|nr:amino acid adenylation domain-containing protein [Rhodococcus sp. (in: high G+C Gram-positive bacteria)]
MATGQESVSRTDHPGESSALPLTAAQRGMWFAERLLPNYSVNVAQYLDIQFEPGGFDHELFANAAVEAGKAAESPYLRIVENDGVPGQVVDLEYEQTVDIIDFRAEPDPLAAAERWMRSEYRRPLDLLTDKLILSVLLRVSDGRTFWYTRGHHIIIDGVAAFTLTRMTLDRYNAVRRGVELAEKPGATMAEIVADEAKYLESSRRQGDADYWRERTREMPERATLSKSAGLAPISADNVVVSEVVDPDLQRRLEGRAAAEGSSLAVVLTAAFGAFMARMTGTDDVVLSLPVSGRATAKIKRGAGMLSNLLPIRLTSIGERTCGELIAAAQVELTGALRHQRYRSDDIRRDAGFSGQAYGFGPSINMVFFDEPVAVDGASADYRILTSGILEDLLFNLYQASPGAPLVIDLHGNPHLYTAATLETHHRRFLAFAERFIDSPTTGVLDIDLFVDQERETVDEFAIAPPNDLEDGDAPTVVEAFAAVVAEHADRVMITDSGRQWTFAEFDAQAKSFAQQLVDGGVQPGHRVVIVLDRGIAQIVAAYATLFTGAAYVPIDPATPVARRESIIEEVVPTVIVDDDYVAGLTFAPDDRRTEFTSAAIMPDSTAYVIFTSGSTGRPKGVQVSHRAMAAFVRWHLKAFPMGVDDVMLAKAPFIFDASVTEMFGGPLAGSRTVIARPGGHADPAYLAELMAREQVSFVQFIPSLLDTFLDVVGDDQLARLQGLPYLILGGEALGPKLAARVSAALPRTAVYNLYGPTETTVDITGIQVSAGHVDSVPIGRPIAGARARVLSSTLDQVPVGVTGDLYVGGTQLADGYYGRPDLTAPRFVADPMSVGDRLYRTGDRARWTVDGVLEYLGREDHQVKIRGQRVELGEIEAVLGRYALVDSAAAIIHQRGVTAVVVAYVKSAVESAAPTVDDLRAWCVTHLPSHMVPSSFVVLDQMPLLPTGKLNRHALPEPELESEAVAYVAPESEIEVAITRILAELLGAEQIGMRDNLFELGADSLVAARLVARVRAAEGIGLTLADVFASEDIGELARAAAASGEPSDRILLAPMPRDGSIPLSYPQTRLWFINRMDPTAATYNMPGAMRIGPETEVDALSAAVADVLVRHESLRTRFPAVDGEPVQQILEGREIDSESILRVVEVSAGELASAISAEATEGFDLIDQTPIRFTLLNVVDETGATVDAVLVVVLHHIAGDGFSLRPLITDLLSAYHARSSGMAPDWEPLPVQYADFAMWQRAVLGDPDDPSSPIATEIDFWAQELAGSPEVLTLPSDRPRPVVPSGLGAYVDTVLPADLASGVRALASRLGVTTFTVFHAALAVVLSRLADTDDVLIGTAVAGREEPETAELVGMFVNTVVLRTQHSASMTVAELVSDAHHTRTRALEHAGVPFEQVVDVLAPYRSRSHSPLVQVALSFLRDDISLLTSDDEFSWIDARPGAAKMDLEVSVTEGFSSDQSSFAVQFCYARDLFDHESIVDFAGNLNCVLEAMVQNSESPIARIDLVGDDDLARQGVASAKSDRPTTLRSLLAIGAERADADVATILGSSGALTRTMFEARTNQLARELIGRGIGAGDTIAVSIPRSQHSVVAMVAVAKTGAAFVVIDPRHPAERRASLVADADTVLGLTTTEVSEPAASVPWIVLDVAQDELQIAGHSGRSVADDELVRCVRPEDVAYILFTSGSTGKPKAAAVSNRAITNLAVNSVETWGMTPDSRMLHVGAPSFDGAMGELWPAMLAGSGVVVADFDSYAGEPLERLIAEHGATHACMTPAVVATLNPVNMPTFCDVACGGEALPPELVHRWTALGDRRIYNIYGPTEAAVWVTCGGPFDLHEDITIGRPDAGVGILVLDRSLRPVPTGVTGEMYVTGEQVGLGYRGQNALTAVRFVANPFAPGTRMYRTGDRVSRRSDGAFDYHGRVDFQLKIRGQRIEPGELDAVLLTHPDVTNAVSVGLPGPSGDTVLASYVSLVEGGVVTPGELEEFVEPLLPSFLIPRAIKIVEEFERTPIGKIDRRRLPPIEFASTGDFIAPRTQLEAVVADVFGQVLGVDAVSVTDSFFDLGGNSLSATRVTSRLGAAIDRDVPVAALFEADTAAKLAAHVSTVLSGHATVRLGRRPRAEVIPLADVQRGMWFLNRADPESSAYNVSLPLRLTGPLDVAALSTAVADLLRRHESLRTSYPMINGAPIQVVHTAQEAVARLDLTPIPAGGDLDAALAELTGRGFDVTVAAPLRLALLQVAEDDHVLVFVIHHISADGSSMAPLARDLMIAYAARRAGHTPPWTPLQVQYADYSVWQAERLAATDASGTTEAQRQLDYWRKRLAGAPELIDLPTDRPRPKRSSHIGGQVDFEIPGELTVSLEQVARESNTTLFMVTQAAYAMLLSRLTGRNDIVIGTPYAGRGEQALDVIVGMFVNSLALRTRIAQGASFAELLGDVRRDDLADMANADVAFDAVASQAGASPSESYNPVFQVMFWFQNIDFPALDFNELRVSPIVEDVSVAKVDLQLTLYPNPPHIEDGSAPALATPAQFIYAKELFDEDTIHSFAERYLRILEAIAADPQCVVGDIDISTEAESEVAGGGDAVTSLADLVSTATAVDPDALAVDQAITFGELSATIAAMSAALPGTDPDSALSMALMSSVPGLAVGGPTALEETLRTLRENATALAGMDNYTAEGNNRK